MSFTSTTRRDLSFAVVARSVSRFGDEVAAFALVLRLRSVGPWAVSAILIANLVPIIVLSGVVGRLVDRIDNRRLLAWPAGVQLIVCVGLAGVDSPLACVAMIGVLGVGQAVTAATWQALLPSLVPPAEVGRALGLAQAGSTLALMAAPGCAGLLVAGLGTHLPLLVDAACFAVVAVIASCLSTGRVLGADPLQDADVRGGSIVRRDPRLRAVIALLALSVLLGSMVNVVEVFLVRDVLHADVVWYGVVGTSYALGMFVAAVLGGRMRSYRRPFLVSAIVLHLGLVAMGLAPTVAWLLVASVLTGAANGMLNVTTSALVAEATQENSRGRVAAVLGGVLAAAQLGAYVTGGAVAAVLSPRAIFVVAGAAGALAPIVLGRALLRQAGAALMQTTAPARRVHRLMLQRPRSSTALSRGRAQSGRLGACARPSTTSSRATAALPPVHGC